MFRTVRAVVHPSSSSVGRDFLSLKRKPSARLENAMRRREIAIAAGSLFGFVTLVSGAAGAAPVMLDQGLTAANTLSPNEGSIIRVFGGCGPYGNRGPWGGCHPGGQWGCYSWRSWPPGFPSVLGVANAGRIVTIRIVGRRHLGTNIAWVQEQVTRFVDGQAVKIR